MILSEEDEAALRGLSVIYGKSPSMGSQANAVATWTAARAEWEAHLSTLSPGRQLYSTTIFVHLVGGDNLHLCRGLLGVGKASTKGKVLKKWMAANPAAAEGQLDIEGGSVSPLAWLLQSVDDIFENINEICCPGDTTDQDGFVPKYCFEVADMAMMLLEASAPFVAEKDARVIELNAKMIVHSGHECPWTGGVNFAGIIEDAGLYE